MLAASRALPAMPQTMAISRESLVGEVPAHDVLYDVGSAHSSIPPCENLPPESGTITARSLSSDTDLIDTLIAWCAETVFPHGFGAIFGRWVGRNGCPLVEDPTADISIAPLKLFGDLDLYMDEQLFHHPGHAMATAFAGPERDKEIDRCLRSTLRAYTARWLPMLIQRNSRGHAVQCDEVSISCWRAARKDMLKLINRPSYRSILALYLFGQTPVPLGISQEEELDGISGVVCSQTALLHVQQLRERLRSCQFNGSEVSAWSDAASTDSATPVPQLTEAYLNLETRAYWATVTWATSESMTLNFRSTLSSGLKGACSEPVWQLSKAFLVASFHDRTETWREKGFRASDDIAPQVISATSVCTIYTWQTIASLKEALREGVEEATVQSAWKALLDAVEVFRMTIQPILSNLERQLHFLGQVDRFNWYEIILLYYLGLLILVDALEAANRSDLLHELAQMSLEAEYECFTVLKFGLESTYTIVAGASGSASISEAGFFTRPLTVSLIAIDPYPHHVVAAVRLMNKAFLRRLYDDTVKPEAYLHLSLTLQKALDQLPQNSKAVHSAKSYLQGSLQQLDIASVDGADFDPGRFAPTTTMQQPWTPSSYRQAPL